MITRVAAPRRIGRMETGVAFASLEPDAEERFFSLRRELGITSFGINQVLLRPGQRGRIHRHEHQEEVYLVISGTLTLWVEGEPHELEEGDLARVGPDVRRQLANPHLENVLVVALGGANEHVGRDGEAFTSWRDWDGAPPQEIPLPDDEPV
jgi:quercetin dioxygenase-like cupin family protein